MCVDRQMGCVCVKSQPKADGNGVVQSPGSQIARPSTSSPVSPDDVSVNAAGNKPPPPAVPPKKRELTSATFIESCYLMTCLIMVKSDCWHVISCEWHVGVLFKSFERRPLAWHVQTMICCHWVVSSELLLQYFDTVGWVFWPVKTVSHVTYTVLVGT